MLVLQLGFGLGLNWRVSFRNQAIIIVTFRSYDWSDLFSSVILSISSADIALRRIVSLRFAIWRRISFCFNLRQTSMTMSLLCYSHSKHFNHFRSSAWYARSEYLFDVWFSFIPSRFNPISTNSMRLFCQTLNMITFHPPDRSDPFSTTLRTDTERCSMTSPRSTTCWSNWPSSFRNDGSHWSTMLRALRALQALQALKILGILCRTQVSDRYRSPVHPRSLVLISSIVLPTEHAAMIWMHIDQASIESIGNVFRYIIGISRVPDMRLVQPKPTAPSFYSVVVITRPSHHRWVQTHD
jgi:hypothetical protein